MCSLARTEKGTPPSRTRPASQTPTPTAATNRHEKTSPQPSPCQNPPQLHGRGGGAHKNTVRRWIKAGLPICGEKHPILILGHDLAAFLQARRGKNKKTCRPGEIYCVRCRHPKFPWGDMAEYQPSTEKLGNLIAICPDCECIINRRVSLAKLEQVRGKMAITFPASTATYK